MAAAGIVDAGPQPFILTLEMDGESFAVLNGLRRRHYAPACNFVPAHVTLFHNLPGERGREIRALLRAVSAAQAKMHIEAREVKALEHGVAVFLRSAELSALRGALAREWWPWLGERDRAGFRPHVTLLNNVADGVARDTQRRVAASWRPRSIRGLGLHLWRYRDGPWHEVELFRFR